MLSRKILKTVNKHKIINLSNIKFFSNVWSDYKKASHNRFSKYHGPHIDILKNKLHQLDLNQFYRPKGDKGFQGSFGEIGEKGKNLFL